MLPSGGAGLYGRPARTPGYVKWSLPTGFSHPNRTAYVGTHPVNLYQAYLNMGGHPIGPAGTGHVPPSPKPPSAPTPPASSTPSTPAGGSSGGAGLDAQYYADVAANNAKIESAINALNLQRGYADTNYQSQLGQLDYQQPRSDLQLEQRSNAAGNLFSSVYGQNLGNLNHGFDTRREAATTAHTRALAGIASRIAGLQAGQGSFDSGQAWASALRAAAAAAKNPPAASSSSPPAASSAAAQQIARRGGPAPKGYVKWSLPSGFPHPNNRLAYVGTKPVNLYQAYLNMRKARGG